MRPKPSLYNPQSSLLSKLQQSAAAVKSVISPYVAKPRASRIVRVDSLQIRDLGVLQGSSEYFHTRHVLANVGEVVLGQAADSKRRDVCAKRFKCDYVPEPYGMLWFGWEAYFSTRKCTFPAMQVPMMMADATPTFLRERSMDSTALMPFSSSMGRG